MALTAVITPASYKQGDVITLTVSDAPRKSSPAVPGTPAVSQTASVTNPDTGASVNVTIGWPAVAGSPAVPAKPFGVADPNRTWVIKSDDGTTAVYNGIA